MSTENSKTTEIQKPTHGICLMYDKTRYIGYCLKEKKILFSVNVGDVENEVLLYIAIGHGLQWAKKLREHNTIYCDNSVSIEFNKKNKCKIETQNRIALNFIDRIERWLVEQRSIAVVELWNIQKHGTINFLNR